MTKIAIVTPVHLPNKHHTSYLSDLLKSTTRLNEDYLHLLINHNSPVNPKPIIESFNDKRIRYYELEQNKNKKNTASIPLNYAINGLLDKTLPNISKKEYNDLFAMTLISYDDIIVDLKKRIDVLEEGHYKAVVSDLFTFQENYYAKRKMVKNINPKSIIKKGNLSGLNHTTAMITLDFINEMKKINKNQYGSSNIFPETISYGEDYAAGKLMVYLASIKNIPITKVSKPSVLIRRHSDSLCSRLTDICIENEKKVIKSVYFSKPEKIIKKSKLIKNIYFNLIKKNKTFFRKIEGAIFHKKELEMVQNILAQIGITK